MRYTQGNWEVWGSLDTLTIGVTQNIHEDDEVFKRIALVSGYDHHVPNYEEAEANAKLMAASKDMYEALIEANRIIQMLCANKAINPAGIKGFDKITSAINKATL